MADMTLVGEKVMIKRRRAGLTQQQLAEKAGVTRQQITLFETGKFQNITALALDRIAKVLGTTSDELLTGEAC